MTILDPTISARIQETFPPEESNYDLGVGDALEAMSLSLQASGMSVEQIHEHLTTSFDAIINNCFL